MLQTFEAQMQPLGAIQSIEFKGVNTAGWDEYHVTHVHGAAGWEIAMDHRGVLVGAHVNPES